jgi:hypothetical protein
LLHPIGGLSIFAFHETVSRSYRRWAIYPLMARETRLF